MTQGTLIDRGATSAALADTRFLSAFGSIEGRGAIEAALQPVRSYRSGIDMVQEGEKAKHLLILTEGWACRYKTMRDGGRQIVALLVPGDIVNLDAMNCGKPDFSVRTLSAAKAVAIACEDVVDLAKRHAGIGEAMTRFALTANSILGQWALCLGRMSAQQRLAHLLCELIERLHPDRSDDGVYFHLPLTQEQMADALGLTPVHINRTLQQMRSDGLIRTEHRTISFPNLGRLRDVAEFDATYLHAMPVMPAGARVAAV